MKIYLAIFGLIFFLACKKEETAPTTPVAIKCSRSTLLDTLLLGNQLYLETKVATSNVLLNLKDKKGVARTVLKGVVNGIYEWDVEVLSTSPTKVTLKAGSIIRAIQGNLVEGYYLPDTFFFNDDNCKITGTSNDSQTQYDKPILFENVTTSEDLASILAKYRY